MIKSIFLCIKERILQKVPEIKDVRVYNSQDFFSDEHLPFMSPTVFVDFSNIDYETTSFSYQRAELNVTLMLFHEEGTANMNHLEVFGINQKLTSYINGWGEWGGLMDRTSSQTDTNYDRLYVLNTEYTTTFEECTLPIDDGTIAPIGDWSKTPFSGSVTGETDWSWEVTGLTENDQIAFEFEIPYSANTNLN